MAKYIFNVEDYSDPNSAKLNVMEFSGLPWHPQRIYWLTEFTNNFTRGNHAHRQLSQVFLMLKGSVKIGLYKGSEFEEVFLSPESGQLLIEPGMWRVISDASDDALLLVLADQPYAEEDYIRNWDEYLEWHRNKTYE
jgi:dTDP-4-dehydrorhamnose 3,5-epimerase-like enzyme